MRIKTSRSFEHIMTFASFEKALRTVMFMMFLFVCTFSISFADDLDPHYKFSGVKSPESPYKNTWGAFQTNLFSGSFTYDYKIPAPPGTNGLAPEVTLSYNSHSAKGKAGWVGAGWDIPLSYIQRDIEYTRKDTSDDTFDLFLDGAKHDLVYVASENLYHTKVEAYLRNEKKTGAPNETGEYWITQTKDGTEYRFGYNLDSENRVRSSDASVPGYVWRWSLDRIIDSNGNCIYFTYIENQGSVYLSKIEYNNDKKRVIEFVLENKPDSYLVIDQGSEVYDASRLSEIQVKVNGSLARKYKLSYATNEIQNKSLLSSITQYGADGVTALPPVRFEYKAADKGFNEGVNWATPGERRIRKTDGDNDTVKDTFDVNGDGLPDYVEYDGNNYLWNIWLNTKNGFASSNVSWSVPSSPDGGWDIRDVEQYIQGSQSPDTRSAPMDLNNDGYIDFLWSDHTNVMQFKINNSGNGFSPSTYSWTLPVAKACVREVIRPDGTNPNVMQDYSDINGDGLPDLVKKENNTSWHIWRNTGSSFVDYGIWPVPHIDAWLEDYTTGDPTELQTGRYDVNGDGLVDIVDAHSTPWKIYLNTGSNFLPAQNWATTFTYINDTNSSGDVKRDFVDMNGDGLPDIVNPVSGIQVWEVFFNTGKGFTSKMSWPVPAEVPQNGYVNNIENSEVGREVLDINGDGLADLVRHIDSVSYWRVYANKSGQADLMTKVTDTLGGTIAVSYTSSMTFSNTRLPYNYWLVSSMVTNNGMTGAHANVSTTNFSYANGLYDFPTREFRGFGQVTETTGDGSIIYHDYFQDEARKGKEYLTERRNGSGNSFFRTVNSWGEASVNGIYISHLNKKEEYTYDGNPSNPKTVRKEYQNYDTYGNIGLQINYGDLGTSGDEVFAYSEYWAPCASGSWIADKARHQYITASAGGTKLRENFSWYDNSTTCPDKGNLTKEEHWLSTGGNPVTTYQYDPYGNRTQTTDPEGRVSRIDYDTTYNTFPEKSYNPKNQLTTTHFNYVTGEPTEVINPNGFTTTFAYDTFNRKIKEVKPYDSGVFPTTFIQYFIDGTAPEYVTVSKREISGQGGTLDTVQSIDGFGSLIQTKTEYENPANMTAVDVYYDEMGRVKKQSNPYLTDSAQTYSTPNASAPSTVYSYDTLGRPVRITNPDGTQISRIFDHWTVTETDENSHAKSYRFDASQRLLQVTENNQGASYLTNYQYSPIGELKQITDHLNNVTTIQYDSLGRKTQMNDPDMGIWHYTYDRIGNIVSQTDAKGVTTNIQYDPLNRKTLIDYPNDTDVEFTYDTDLAGTLSEVVDSTGTVTYQYDNRYRKTTETRNLDGHSWATQWSYDAMDRVISQTYPDGESVNYTYNSKGSLESLAGIIPNIDYNASGQIVQKSYINGKSAAYSYNNTNHRLESIVTTGIQDLAYTYDNVGNIKTLKDDVEGKTETFSYDGLDRLTSAGDSGYSSQYQYNAIGNMTSMTKDGKNYNYTYGANAGPHAVTGMTVPYLALSSFALDNGNEYTTTGHLTLNNGSMGNPTEYIASENVNFSGASWQPYSSAPALVIAPGYGQRTVYFKIRNGEGESKVWADSIDYLIDTDSDAMPDKYDADDDGDGMPDTWEDTYGFNPLVPSDATGDKDFDGLSNLGEFQNGADPEIGDTDSDGLGDYEEVFTYLTDPADADSDDDGLIDFADPYPNSTYHYGLSENYKVMQPRLNEGGDVRASSLFNISDIIGDAASRKTFIDTDDDNIMDKDDLDDDNDGIPDIWEIAHNMDPLDYSDGGEDIDGDGLSNYLEYINGTGLNIQDTDNDGLNDYLEVVVYHSNPLDTDTDDDGLIDSIDPAPTSIYHYGISENYSFRNGSVNEGGDNRASVSFKMNDIIGDAVSQKTFLDNDNDGIMDRDDLDDDGDSIPDLWEIDHGMNPLNYSDAGEDFDGDGLTNLQEFQLGSDINNIDSPVYTAPIYNAENGHYYKKIYVGPEGSGITWDDAKTAAESLSYFGYNGHLATITSQNEDDFINYHLGGLNGYWIGGYQPEGSTEPGVNWQWITGEAWSFTHWQPGEPNDYYGGEWGGPPAGSSENSLHYVNWDGSPAWNDFPNGVYAPGYIVEYGTVGDILFQDNFDDGDADGWAEYDGVFEINDGIYFINSTSLDNDARAVNGGTNWTNYVFDADFNFSAGHAALLFRIEDIVTGTDQGRYYQFFVLDSSVGFCEMNFDNDGCNVIASNNSFSTSLNDWHHVRLVINGAETTAYIDNRLALHYDGFTSYSSGQIGLKAINGVTNYYDNVVVSSISPVSDQISSVLSSGWNLISLPIQPIDTSIDMCLDTVYGLYNIVWAYQDNEWSMNNPSTPIFNTLETMEAGKGYWIYMTAPATLTVSGGIPVKSVQLTNGWNLVGYNSKTAQPIENILASIDGKYVSVWAFINNEWQFYAPGNIFSSLETIEPGYGYWINTTEACTWTLP